MYKRNEMCEGTCHRHKVIKFMKNCQKMKMLIRILITRSDDKEISNWPLLLADNVFQALFQLCHFRRPPIQHSIIIYTIKLSRENTFAVIRLYTEG